MKKWAHELSREFSKSEVQMSRTGLWILVKSSVPSFSSMDHAVEIILKTSSPNSKSHRFDPL
jgi:hypothetical protein